MRQIDYLARWDQTNSHLKPGYLSIFSSFLSPLHSLCRKFMMPATQIPAQLAERVDQLWREQWEPQNAESTGVRVRDPNAVLLRTHYEPIIMNLTTPDGVPIQATFYRHRRSASHDVPTIICAEPNGQLSRMGGWDWVLKKGCTSPVPFNLITFDYRDCGTSGGTLNSLRNLELDAETVYAAAKEGLGISERNLHFLGYSMGGSVAAKLAANHPLSGRCVNLNSFDCLENVIKHSSIIDQIVESLPIPVFLQSFSGFVRSILGSITSFAGWGMDVRAALESIKERTLFVYHPQDPMIPEAAAAVNAVAFTSEQARSHVVKLQFKPTVRNECAQFNYHTAPMHFFQDERGLNASKRILNFILGQDLFVQHRPQQNRSRVTIHPSGEISRT